MQKDIEQFTREMEEYVYTHQPIWFKYITEQDKVIYINRSRMSVYMDNNINTRVTELAVHPTATKEQAEIFDVYRIDPTTIRNQLKADSRINWVKYCEVECDDLLTVEYAKSLGYGTPNS